MCHSHCLALPSATSTALGAWGHGGTLVHPKRWHFSSRTVPPGPVTLWGFIPRAGTGQPEQSQAIRCKSCLENIPAQWGLQWGEDSSLHKGSHKLQPSLRAQPQPGPGLCCPEPASPEWCWEAAGAGASSGV